MQTITMTSNELADQHSATATKPKATRLSLVDAIPASPPTNTPSIRPPPGLELEILEPLAPPPGLGCFEADGKDLGCAHSGDETLDAGSESDDTSVGSAVGYQSSDIDSGAKSDGDSQQGGDSQQTSYFGGLVLAERSALRTSSPTFIPMLSEAGAALLMPDVAPTPLRAKLCSKSEAFIPQPVLPTEAGSLDAEDWGSEWQWWHTQDYSAQSGVEDWGSEWQWWQTNEPYNFHEFVEHGQTQCHDEFLPESAVL